MCWLELFETSLPHIFLVNLVECSLDLPIWEGWHQVGYAHSIKLITNQSAVSGVTAIADDWWQAWYKEHYQKFRINEKSLPKKQGFLGKNYLASNRPFKYILSLNFLVGLQYMGLQYHEECYCDNDYGTYGKADESDCNLHCRGNTSQTCGGHCKNSIWRIIASKYAVRVHRINVNQQLLTFLLSNCNCMVNVCCFVTLDTVNLNV